MRAASIDSLPSITPATASIGHARLTEARCSRDESSPLLAGTIGYDEFLEIMAQRIAARSPEEELAKAFQLFDEDSSGRISLLNMRRIAKELGENLTDDELQAMIDEFDTDGDGEISAQEFANIMKSTSLYE